MTADVITPPDQGSNGRGSGALDLRRLAMCGPLVAILLACCPVPTGTGADTAFAAELQTMTDGGAFALTEDGRRVHLTFAASRPEQQFAAGQRVYVEGLLTGKDVRVRRMIGIEPARTG